MVRHWVLRTLTALLSITLTLAVVELGFRLLWMKRLTIPAGIDDPHFHHRLPPNTTYHYVSAEFDVTVRTNRYGLRGRDPAIPKPPGVVRILMLGDSFTYGFPVKDEETFSALVERDLRAKGYPVEVVDGGVSGYSPTLEYLSLRDQFLAFEPDLVILWYDRGDLQEDYWFQKNLLFDASGRIVRCDPRCTHGHFDRWEWLKNHSALAKYLDIKVFRTFDRVWTLGLTEFIRMKLRGERAKVAVARLKAAQRVPDLPAYDRFLWSRESSTVELVKPYWSLSAKYLLMIRDLLAERHIPFMLGTYPYGMSVAPDEWSEGRKFWGFQPGKVYRTGIANAIFREFSEREHIPWISTKKHFQDAAAASEEKLYYDHDGHFTPAGHRVLAARVVSDPQFLQILQAQVARVRRAQADGGARILPLDQDYGRVEGNRGFLLHAAIPEYRR